MRARDNMYHIDCFRCVACSRQLIPGDEFALKEDELFCKADHDVVERASTKENGDDIVTLRNTKSADSINNDNNNNKKENGLHQNSGKE